MESSLEGRLDVPDELVAVEAAERPEASRWANAMVKGLSASVEHICARSKPLAFGPDPYNREPINLHGIAVAAQRQKAN